MAKIERTLRQVSLVDMNNAHRVCWIEGGLTVRVGDAISLMDDPNHTWFIEKIYVSLPAKWIHNEPSPWKVGGNGKQRSCA